MKITPESQKAKGKRHKLRVKLKSSEAESTWRIERPTAPQVRTRREDGGGKIDVMPRDFKDVFRDAAELSERDRATLAGLLIESLDSAAEPDVEAAWMAEIERRVAELDAGNVKTIPWEEVRQRLFDRLNGR